jgi:hypothetical protein
MKPLPIGVQTFADFKRGNYLYVDKTKIIYELIKNTKGVYFLSRPRRFGKSLLLSILSEIFQGNKELFQGLWLYGSAYNWKKHPIIHLDFSKQKCETPEQLKTYLMNQLMLVASRHEILLTRETYFEQFEELIHKMGKEEQIVLLIDEYDKPIIDHLKNPKLAETMREVIKGFFSVLKGNDAYIRFLFITGVSKFSKAGVFSDVNHLEDLSLDNQYSDLLGITENELNENFSDYISDFSKKENLTEIELINKIRYWYNGFQFSGEGVSVYNPFSTLLLFKKQEFANYWFETGTPSFLLKLMIEKNYDILEIPLVVDRLMFSTYEIDNLTIPALLFQTGYLTIKGYNKERTLYTLDYPNFEVKRAFLTFFTQDKTKADLSETMLYKIIDSLREKDIETCIDTLRLFFSKVDYSIQINQEKYYQTIFYVIFTLLGLKIGVEIVTNKGRIDAVIEDKDIFIFEFKFTNIEMLPVGKKRRKNKVARDAIKQIKAKQYPEKYKDSGKSIYLIGAEFINRNIGDWVVSKNEENHKPYHQKT